MSLGEEDKGDMTALRESCQLKKKKKVRYYSGLKQKDSYIKGTNSVKLCLS